MKTVTLTAHFDEEHILLDEPFELPSDARLLVTIVPAPLPDAEREQVVRAFQGRLGQGLL
jgi:hypothetical protein